MAIGALNYYVKNEMKDRVDAEVAYFKDSRRFF